MVAQNGGAIYCNSSTINLSNCTFSDNTAANGGAACFQSSDPVVVECSFIDNIANTNGGGIVCDSSGGLFMGCSISGNSTIESNSAGGGFYSDSYSSTLTFIQCDINRNSCAIYGGGIYFKNCGAQSSISRCTFLENSALWGGGIYFAEATNPLVGGEEELENSFDNNTAGCGVDMCTVPGRSTVINAGYNHFSGYHLSHYYVAPQSGFDVSGCISALTPIEQDVYIAPDGDDNNDGLTPCTPFKTLLHATRNIYGSESNPLTIHLAPGKYSRSTTGESIPIQLIDYTIIKGQSTETTIMDGEGSGPVLYSFGVTSTLEAVTVTGGASESAGGGINGFHADLIVKDCIISENPPEDFEEDKKGGGISTMNSSLTVTNSLIERNGIGSTGSGVMFAMNESKTSLALIMSGCTVSENCSTGSGGGINIGFPISSFPRTITVDIDNCNIHDNMADSSGGGIYVVSSGGNSSGLIVGVDDCTIQGNISGSNGGGVSCTLNSPRDSLLIQDSTIENNQLTSFSSNCGGGLYVCSHSDGVIRNCLIKDNLISGSSSSYGYGGGIYYYSDGNSTGIIQNCVIQGNTVELGSSYYSIANGGGIFFSSDHNGIIENCVIRDNTAEKSGGVYYLLTGYGNNLTNRMINCTVFGNTANDSHGGLFVHDSTPITTIPVVEICNMIIRNNTPGQIGMSDSEDMTVRTTFCNVSGGFPGLGNIDQDPRFASTADFHLRSESPCIDSGTNRFVTNLDCDLNPRLQGGEYDMGAYEYAGWPDQIRVYLSMPLHYYHAGETCSCEATVRNPGASTIKEHPLFVVLCAYGAYFFAPGFSDFDYFARDYPPGQTTVTVLPAFTWPDIEGYVDDILWIAALTDPGITQLYGAPDFFSFGWH